MLDIEKPNTPPSASVADALKSWVMVFLSLIFVLLYAGALISYMASANARILETLNDLQPIIFVIIGYYFGRLPGQQNENQIKNTLKEEIDRAAAGTDNANKAKENAIKEKAAIEGKMEAAKTVLSKSDSLDSSISAEAMSADGKTIQTAIEILSTSINKQEITEMAPKKQKEKAKKSTAATTAPGECLTFTKAGDIVLSCAGPHDIDVTLGEIGFGTEPQLEGFQDCVFDGVSDNGCSIQRSDIPHSEDNTLREVIEAIKDAAF